MIFLVSKSLISELTGSLILGVMDGCLVGWIVGWLAGWLVWLARWLVGGHSNTLQDPSVVKNLPPAALGDCPLWGLLQLRATSLSSPPFLQITTVPELPGSYQYGAISTQPFCPSEGWAIFRTPQGLAQLPLEHCIFVFLCPVSFSPLTTPPPPFPWVLSPGAPPK